MKISDFTYIGVGHRILRDVRSKLNINKLRRILKVSRVPVRRDGNNHMNTERIRPIQVQGNPGLYD